MVEEAYSRLMKEEMTVWDEKHPQPPGGPDFERRLVRHWYDDAQKQLAAIQPKDAATLAKWREVVGGGIDAILGRGLPAAADLDFEKTEEIDQGSYIRFAGLLRNKPRGEELPLVSLHPKNWKGKVVIWLSEQGKAGLFGKDGGPSAEVEKLLDAGTSVVGVDLMLQGEFLADGVTPAKNRG